MPSVKKCLILAAGRGSRLAGWGALKPRLRLLGVPLIERVIPPGATEWEGLGP